MPWVKSAGFVDQASSRLFASLLGRQLWLVRLSRTTATTTATTTTPASASIGTEGTFAKAGHIGRLLQGITRKIQPRKLRRWCA